jgi:hypothetical protein
MDDQNKMVTDMSQPSSYVDPPETLSRDEINQEENVGPNVISRRTRLHYCFDKLVFDWVLSFVFFLLLIYLIYILVLAYYNCEFDNIKLGWIRASIFLNVPFLLAILIDICAMYKQNDGLRYLIFVGIVLIYTFFSVIYTLCIAVSFELTELKEIRTALNNETYLNLLPCSKIYYQQMFVTRIINYFFPIATIDFLYYYIFYEDHPEINLDTKRYDRCIFSIVNKWRNFLYTIFQRR